MKDYKTLIMAESEKIHRLHESVHETFQRRDKDRHAWEKACEEFHSYVSRIDPFIDRAYKEDQYTDKELLEFVFAFAEIDPLFFVQAT